MRGNTESDYLLFVDDKAVAVVEAKREENPLDETVEKQAEGYAHNPQDWYVYLWFISIDIGELSIGTSIPQINNKDIYPLVLPLPPADEQIRIVGEVKRVLSLLG